MADLLAKASEWLGRQRRKHLSQEVTYLRGTSSVSVPATLGRQEFDQDDGTGSGFAVKAHSHDFLIDVADLELDGIPVEPQRGDQIIVGTIDEGVVYEVMSIPGQGFWTHADPYRLVYRIHTKQIGVRP